MKHYMLFAGSSVQAQQAIYTPLFITYICYALSLMCSDIKSCITELSASLNIKNTNYYVISQQDVCNCAIPAFLGVVKYIGRMPALI